MLHIIQYITYGHFIKDICKKSTQAKAKLWITVDIVSQSI